MNNRIMFFLDECIALGGATHTLLRQAILAKKAGYEIYVCRASANELGKPFKILFDKYDISIKTLPYKIFSHTEEVDIEGLINGYDEVKQYIQKIHPVLLHSVQVNVVVEMVSRELKIPHIMNVYQALSAFFNISYMNVYPHYHICDSWYYAKKWEKGIGTRSTCIRTFAEPGKERSAVSSELDGIVKFICVGQIYDEKNQLSVIKAFEQAINRGVKGTLELYGNDTTPYAYKCKEYVRMHRLDECIFVNGFSSDMKSVYESSDVLICGSVRESYPNVISEALANNLIIITTPVAGVPEIIKDGENGYVTTDFSPEKICDKILQFDFDKKNQNLKKIYQNMKQTYLDNHSEKAVTSQLLEYYTWVQKDFENYTLEKRPQRKDVLDAIKPIYSEVQLNCHYFSRPDLILQKMWYVYHIKPIVERISTDKKAFIWGAGTYSEPVREMIEFFFKNIKITGYIDSFAEKEDLRNIIRPEEILREDIFIFIGTRNAQHAIMDMLKKYDKVCNRDYFVMAPRYW